MNLVDSSGWLAYFADDPNADFFASAIEDAANLVVPTLSLFEVYKRINQQRHRDDALQAVAVMQQGRVVDLSADLALRAAELSQRKPLPLADSVMLATARAHNAVFWTQDSDFEGMESVQYVAKSS